MNNDILVTSGWRERLINSAREHALQLASTALIEGDHDYNLEDFSSRASIEMSGVFRRNFKHAVCMAIHDSVFREIGFFRPEPKLLGYEDTLFFHKVDSRRLSCGIVGSSWVHHFGSITQKIMKEERGLSDDENLGYRWNNRLLNQSWITRKIKKREKIRLLKNYSSQELRQFKRTLHGLRQDGKFVWL